MNWDDQPIQPAQPLPPATRLGGFRRSIVIGTMAIGLLALGGVAAVSAADPSPSPDPNATAQPSASDAPASSAHRKGDCPNDGSGRGNNGTTPDASPDVTPDASPDASPEV
jgi:hypothetical protein